MTTRTAAAVLPPARRALVALVAALLLLLATPVLAPDLAPHAAAVEEVTEDVGPEVRGPNDEDNAFAPSDLEANYLWGANWGLLVLTAFAFGVGGLLYWLKVGRFERAER